MRNYQDIYSELKEKTDQRFTTYEVLDIFRKEDNNWVGSSWQMMKLQELSHEITGIRPGNCSGCKIDVIHNMVRWLNNYEKEHPLPVEAEKPKRKRIGE